VLFSLSAVVIAGAGAAAAVVVVDEDVVLDRSGDELLLSSVTRDGREGVDV